MALQFQKWSYLHHGVFFNDLVAHFAVEGLGAGQRQRRHRQENRRRAVHVDEFPLSTRKPQVTKKNSPENNINNQKNSPHNQESTAAS